MEVNEFSKDRKKKRNPPVDVQNLVYGKVPPQAKEMEKAILGAIMIQKDAIDKVSKLMIPEAFYIDAHQRIYQAMTNLVKKSRPQDLLTVEQELKEMESLELIGGQYYLTELTLNVVSSANIEAHAETVYKMYIQREMIRTGVEMIQEGYQEASDVQLTLDRAEKSLSTLSTKMNSTTGHDIGSLVVEGFQQVMKNIANKGKLTGVTSGFKKIDQITNGWQKSELWILAARPAVGKTALALKLARNAAKSRTPVALFSLEMSAKSLVQRMMSAESRVPFVDLQRGRFEDYQDPKLKQLHQHGVKDLEGLGIHINDQSSMNVFELKAEARRLKKKHNIGMIIVDYLQLMNGTNSNQHGNRESQISEISRNLKLLAKELDVPVIALSQLSRATEGRADKRPVLSDLRESGAIEQDADGVIFIYRPEYYSVMVDEHGNNNAGVTNLNFAKNRNGIIDTVSILAELWCQNFVDAPDYIPAKKTEEKKPRKNGITQLWTPIKKEENPEEPVKDEPF